MTRAANQYPALDPRDPVSLLILALYRIVDRRGRRRKARQLRLIEGAK